MPRIYPSTEDTMRVVMKYAYINSPLFSQVFHSGRLFLAFSCLKREMILMHPFGNFDHPHDIHHIQNHTSSSPGTELKTSLTVRASVPNTEYMQLQKGGIEAIPHYEEYCCHKYSIDDISLGNLDTSEPQRTTWEKIKETLFYSCIFLRINGFQFTVLKFRTPPPCPRFGLAKKLVQGFS